MNESLLFLLPAYDEEQAVPSVLRDIKESFPSARVLLVDDGSKDGTSPTARAAARELGLSLILLRHSGNLGLGKALSTGINYAAENISEKYLVIFDADATHPARLVHEMIEKAGRGADLVIASRYTRGGAQINLSRGRAGASRIFSLFFHIFFPSVTDFSSGFRLYRLDFLRKKLFSADLDSGFVCSFELLLLCLRKGAKIDEVPLFLDYGLKKSRSKFSFFKTLVSYLMIFRKFLP